MPDRRAVLVHGRHAGKFAAPLRPENMHAEVTIDPGCDLVRIRLDDDSNDEFWMELEVDMAVLRVPALLKADS